jgi:hypothetical protein
LAVFTDANIPASDGSPRAAFQPEPSGRGLSAPFGWESGGKMGDRASIPQGWRITLFIATHLQEHLVALRDPLEALANWIRVVRPGGYLVISVPDGDPYERGTWPSTFNKDRKITFTVCKKSSWSLVSVNVFDLLAPFCDRVKPVSVIPTDHYQTPRFGSTPLSQCAIEFVLKKQIGGGKRNYTRSTVQNSAEYNPRE